MPAKKQRANSQGARKQAAKPRTMSDAHKAALAEGRELGRAVRQYLEALDSTKPQRGRRRTPDSVRKRLAKLPDEIATADAAKRVSLIQERIDLERELAELSNSTDIAALETGFVAAAKRYSEIKGLSYAAWREAGVPAAVLKAADIRRST